MGKTGKLRTKLDVFFDSEKGMKMKAFFDIKFLLIKFENFNIFNKSTFINHIYYLFLTYFYIVINMKNHCNLLILLHLTSYQQ